MNQISTTVLPESGWVYAHNGTAILHYEVEIPHKVLHVEWQAGAPLEDVKWGFLELARLLQETRCFVLISDSNHYIGCWQELIPWVRYEFLPLALSHGLRYLADVLPLDPANSFSIYSWREETRGIVHHEVFSTLSLARQWVMGVLKAG